MYIISAVMAAVNFALLRIFCFVLFFYLTIYTRTYKCVFVENPTNFYFLLGTKIQGINHGYNFKLLSAITPETKNGNIVFSLFYLFIGVDNNFLLPWRDGILGIIVFLESTVTNLAI